MLGTTTDSGRMSARTLACGFGFSLAAAIALTVVLRRDSVDRTHAPQASKGQSASGPQSFVEAPAPIPSPPANPASARARNAPAAEPADREGGSGEKRRSRSPLTFEELRKLLRSNASDLEKCKALQENWKVGLDPTLAEISYVLTDPASGQDLRAQAVRMLAGVARNNARACEVLLGYVTSSGHRDPSRQEALIAACRWGSDDDLTRCTEIFYRETDPDSVVAAAQALAANPSTSARSLLTSLASTHSDPETRHRIEEIATGRFCPEHEPPTVSANQDE